MIRRLRPNKGTGKAFCGNCGHAVWYRTLENSDWHKKPICCVCQFSKFKQCRTQYGCKHWTARLDGDCGTSPDFTDINNNQKEC